MLNAGCTFCFFGGRPPPPALDEEGGGRGGKGGFGLLRSPDLSRQNPAGHQLASPAN